MSIGLLTYHSGYNYGSTLQAYATLCQLKRIDPSAMILNYRMKEQDRFYRPTCRFDCGMKATVKDLLQLPIQRKKVQRALKFEEFFEKYLSLTPRVAEPEEVAKQWEQFDTLISGSDQIWNKHSCELAHNDWRYMDPYLLKGSEGRKISYASSVANMTDEELQYILPELRQFDALSFRESVSAEKMSALLVRPVATVLDPTFLLTKDEWIAHLQLQKKDDEKYILVYSLGGPKQVLRLLPVLPRLSKKRDCKLKVITPFAYFPYPDKHIAYHPEYGPIEFLHALYNAETVVTDSYHGTIFSVNFGKEFYSICKSGGSEFRKTDILNRLGLQDRIIFNPAAIPELALPPIDYNAVYAKLEVLRQHSIEYLQKTLEGSRQ